MGVTVRVMLCLLLSVYRVLVGAPRANSTYSSSVRSPGAVYKCRVHSNPERRCTEMDLGRGQYTQYSLNGSQVYCWHTTITTTTIITITTTTTTCTSKQTHSSLDYNSSALVSVVLNNQLILKLLSGSSPTQRTQRGVLWGGTWHLWHVVSL